MQGPCARALRTGGIGDCRYKLGHTVGIRVSGGGKPPPEWKNKRTFQAAFGDFGNILKINFDVEEGLGTIEFEDKDDAADAAQAMDGKKISGVVVDSKLLDQKGGMPGTRSVFGAVEERIYEMAQKHSLDDPAVAQLIKAFQDRVRKGCDLNRDAKEFSEHLSASNKPSAYVCMKLSELKAGLPIGPCQFAKNKSRRDEHRSPDGERDRRKRTRDQDEGRSQVRDKDGRDKESDTGNDGRYKADDDATKSESDQVSKSKRPVLDLEDDPDFDGEDQDAEGKEQERLRLLTPDGKPIEYLEEMKAHEQEKAEGRAGRLLIPLGAPRNDKDRRIDGRDQGRGSNRDRDQGRGDYRDREPQQSRYRDRDQDRDGDRCRDRDLDRERSRERYRDKDDRRDRNRDRDLDREQVTLAPREGYRDPGRDRGYRDSRDRDDRRHLRR